MVLLIIIMMLIMQYMIIFMPHNIMSYELRLEYNENCLVNDNPSKCMNLLEKNSKKNTKYQLL